MKSTGCSYRGPGFGSQHPLGGSQPSITPVSGNPLLASTSTRDVHIYVGNILTHIKIKTNKSLKTTNKTIT